MQTTMWIVTAMWIATLYLTVSIAPLHEYLGVLQPASICATVTLENTLLRRLETRDIASKTTAVSMVVADVSCAISEHHFNVKSVSLGSVSTSLEGSAVGAHSMDKMTFENRSVPTLIE